MFHQTGEEITKGEEYFFLYVVCVAGSFLNSSCRLDAEDNENTVGVVDIPLLCRYNVCRLFIKVGGTSL